MEKVYSRYCWSDFLFLNGTFIFLLSISSKNQLIILGLYVGLVILTARHYFRVFEFSATTIRMKAPMQAMLQIPWETVSRIDFHRGFKKKPYFIIHRKNGKKYHGWWASDDLEKIRTFAEANDVSAQFVK